MDNYGYIEASLYSDVYIENDTCFTISKGMESATFYSSKPYDIKAQHSTPYHTTPYYTTPHHTRYLTRPYQTTPHHNILHHTNPVRLLLSDHIKFVSVIVLHRKLTSEQRRQVLETCCKPTALYMKLACDTALQWKSFTTDTHTELTPTATELIIQLFERY